MLGRAKYFAIFRVESNGTYVLSEKRPNPYEHTLQRGKTFDVMNVLSDCQVILSRSIGKKGIERMKKAGFRVILTKQPSIEEALTAFLSEHSFNTGQNNGTG